MQPPTHHPPHIYLDDTWYLITSRVYDGRRLLRPEGHKELVRDQLKALVTEFKLRLAAWAILDNHSHILVKEPDRRHGEPLLGPLAWADIV